jgi:maltooligosyltrehalose trehalohydrolase
VHFRVWAPSCSKLTLVLEAPYHSEHVFEREPRGGYYWLHLPGVTAGARYRLRLNDSPDLCADPASRFQPEGPFGPSEVIDPHTFEWTDSSWAGITAPEKQVLYEMHVGTFTPEGTWWAASEHLPYLAEIGVTTIEMMPANDYAGARGWGYDGVNLWAPTRNHGLPDDLRRFVDRAHSLGLAVILDVVYNHIGPSGNSLFRFAPFKHETREGSEWGDALDFGKPGVREFFVANAGYWIDEFHFDGLRLDATQSMHDDLRPHVLADIVRRARSAAGTRRIFIVGENEPQDVTLLESVEEGGCGLDALWNDDFEHSCRVALTGATDGYFHDYRGRPQEFISAVKYSFLYQGQVYAWQRNVRGSPTRGLQPWRFVHCLENHDQIANTGFGNRVLTMSNPAAYRALLAVMLFAPQLPMLFQGQEYGALQPWRFFVDHDAELDRLVRIGRASFLSQFARLGSREAQAMLPDPGSETTFVECVLDPAERRLDSPLARMHRDLLRLRREHPAFTDPHPGVRDGAVLSDRAFCVRWWHDSGDRLLLVNLGETFRQAVLPEPLLAPPRRTGWKTVWSSEDPVYGGHGTPDPFTVARLAIPAYSAVLCAPDPSAWLRVDPAPESGEKAPIDP